MQAADIKRYMRIVNAWDAASRDHADVLARDFPHANSCSIRDPERCPGCAKAGAAFLRVHDAVRRDVPGIVVDIDEIKEALEWYAEETGRPSNAFLLPKH